VLKKAELRSIRFHDLRHTFASQLLSKGTNILYVSQQLGHANPGVTMKIYAKWIPNEGQRQAMNNLPYVGKLSDVSDNSPPFYSKTAPYTHPGPLGGPRVFFVVLVTPCN